MRPTSSRFAVRGPGCQPNARTPSPPAYELNPSELSLLLPSTSIAIAGPSRREGGWSSCLPFCFRQVEDYRLDLAGWKDVDRSRPTQMWRRSHDSSGRWRPRASSFRESSRVVVRRAWNCSYPYCSGSEPPSLRFFLQACWELNTLHCPSVMIRGTTAHRVLYLDLVLTNGSYIYVYIKTVETATASKC